MPAALAFFFLDLFLDAAAGRERLPEQHRDERAEDDDFLERAVPERGIALEQPDQDRADGGRRIADQPADDGADEGLQADQEAGVVIERRDRPDQDAGNPGQRRGQQEGDRARGRGQDADQAGADAIDRGGAQAPCRSSVCSKITKQQKAEHRRARRRSAGFGPKSLIGPSSKNARVIGSVRKPSGPKKISAMPEITK